MQRQILGQMRYVKCCMCVCVCIHMCVSECVWNVMYDGLRRLPSALQTLPQTYIMPLALSYTLHQHTYIHIRMYIAPFIACSKYAGGVHFPND